MKAYIHGFQGRAYNDDCQTAMDGFQKLGIDTVLFSTNEEFDTRRPEDVVVGGTIMIWHALNQRGITAEHYDYPTQLNAFLGRKIWMEELGNIGVSDLPIFVKPVEEKIAPGIVINSMDDLWEEYGLLESSTELYCSEPVDFLSEWRCFLLHRQLIGIQYYYGNQNVVCDRSVIDAAVTAFANAPAGCALDFGVTSDGRTLLIEVNDGYSLGAYGLDEKLYAMLLTARWAELNNTIDIFDIRS